MGTQAQWRSGKKFTGLVVLSWLLLFEGVAQGIEKLQFKPGFNLFSPAQDVQAGREAAADADKQLPVIKDSQVDGYINTLGRRLASYAPYNNSDYSWTFKVVNSQDINAFALPGGFIYVNRGAIEAAQNEAEIAGVMAHEIGHVVLRHGTHQASQMMLAQAPLAILGGILGQSSGLMARLAEMGIGFGVQSVFLKNSRTAESQADEVGTYILHQARYDPYAMAQFFQIIQKKYPQQTLQFFSDHPNPENRIKDVDAEIARLGPVQNPTTDSREFESVKKRLQGMPVPKKSGSGPAAAAAPAGPPPAPSRRMLRYQGGSYSLDYPDNWKVQEGDGVAALYPPGGMVSVGSGAAQAYGASISRYQPKRAKWNLSSGTQELLDTLRQDNPNMRIVKQISLQVQGRPALSTLLENDSPLEKQKEVDQLITLSGRDSLLSIIFISPQSAFDSYWPTFDSMLQSLKFNY